jgi:glycosyltransferase involved in cell wall biosynthesis
MNDGKQEVDMEDYQIAVLIPCYNAAEYLSEALSSILQQSYSNIAIILLDDGSTDETWRIATSFAAKDSRLKLYQHPQNLGIIASRNTLLEHCTSNYAAWMDADDIAHPQRLERQLRFMLQHPDYVACTCHYTRREGELITQVKIDSKMLSREALLFYNFVLNPGSFFNAKLCKQKQIHFRTWISGASDYLFWVEMAKVGKIGVVPECLMTYRIHPGQETQGQKVRQLNGCLEIVQAQLAEFNCSVDQQDLARLLIYPAQILDQSFSKLHLRRGEQIVRAILTALPVNEFDRDKVEALLIAMFRSLARPLGLRGFWRFIVLFKLAGLRQCQNYGVNLFWACLNTDLTKLVGIFDRRPV